MYLCYSLAGMSRSVTVAVAYIMSVTSLSWKEALKVVRVGRSVANPNFGFQKQLHEFEIYRLSEVCDFVDGFKFLFTISLFYLLNFNNNNEQVLVKGDKLWF